MFKKVARNVVQKVRKNTVKNGANNGTSVAPVDTSLLLIIKLRKKLGQHINVMFLASKR